MSQQNFFQQIEQLSLEKITKIKPLPGSALSLALTHIAKTHNRPFLIVTADNQAAMQLEQELQFFCKELHDLSIKHFPDWETLPYDQFSPHQDIISERLKTLWHWLHQKRGIGIVSLTTLMHRLAPREFLYSNTFLVKKGDVIDIDKLRLQLIEAGYRFVNQVMEHGEFGIRGSIIDLYPMGAEFPFRIDLFDNEVETIRTFDPDTQRSIEKIEQIQLLPAHEFPLTESAINRFRQGFRDILIGNPSKSPLYQDVSQGLAPAGIEYYLPLFFEKTENLFDYLPQETVVIQVGNLFSTAEQFWQEIQERYEQRRSDIYRPLLAPRELFLPVEELFAHFKQFSQLKIIDDAEISLAAVPAPQITLDHHADKPFQAVETFLLQHNQRILFCAETAGRRESLLDLLASIDIKPAQFETFDQFLSSTAPIALTIAPLERGLQLLNPEIIVLTESQLFGQQVMQRRRRSKTRTVDGDAIIRHLAELNIGAPVVHIDHGVGRYQGLQTLTVGDTVGEYLVLQYADNDKVYVPVALLHLISRYSGVDPEHAPIHKLGGDQWEKAKRKAAEKIRDVAAELLDVYAKRAAKKGHAFQFSEDAYLSFVRSFPFEETLDQEQAIESVIQDMKAEKTMDRLVCGDVGFGKTEVAMRAAFIALQAGKQVAVLVPTTLLAQQHFRSFQDRFADWPVKIEMLSRFRSKKEIETAIEQLAEGKIDLIIGTHRLLQPDVRFKNLGLVIIDEEHRFGVRQKEQLKTLRAEVDILTLTATPIPRTLNMAMNAIRDLSIIATPPAKRLSIKTFVQERNQYVIREATMREILRGGQVYFVHNNVETIDKIADEITQLIPEARVGIAHGQMRESELERVMSDFYHNRFNVLVCTTIIETGIDIPTANTIIIDRADRFGLAQLHQLRGRVGRSHHQAYAYLMTPDKNRMTADAEKRLNAIASLEDLGAGFTLATHDMEIRGVGELLGEEQSGNIQTIGFNLYSELLDRAVRALKSGQNFDIDITKNAHSEINLHIPTLIPEDYLPDVHIRLVLYKRIANAKSSNELDDLQVEMIDRFGLIPEATKNLFRITELKLLAEKIGIKKIESTAQGGRIEFQEPPHIDPSKIIQLLQEPKSIFKLDGSNRLKYTKETTSAAERIQAVKEILNRFLS